MTSGGRSLLVVQQQRWRGRLVLTVMSLARTDRIRSADETQIRRRHARHRDGLRSVF